MSKIASKPVAPDQEQRARALDPTRSILVQAPAGSGKTTLLKDRFLTLLAEVDEPGEVVAITFTKAAAAEMRNRILDELRSAEPGELAQRVLDRSSALNWRLLDLPAQLRISTIDSFCRDLALQQPLLSGLGGGLDIAEQFDDLYRRAARHTLTKIGDGSSVSNAVENLLRWRDNNWQELEDLLVFMLARRDQWMQSFVLSQNPDWAALREQLERPFARAVHRGLVEVSELLDCAPGARAEALMLARFACAQPEGEKHRTLAELVEFPNAPFTGIDELEEAQQALDCFADLVLTKEGGLRQRIDKNLGFPSHRKAEKARIEALIRDLRKVPGLETALAAVRELPPIRYGEDDWSIVRAGFTLLRDAAAQLKVVFAETARVDYVEVAQIANGVLRDTDGMPTEAAQSLADGIRHLLVDEFQDTSRRQHQLLAGLIAAWPDTVGRTLFAVGDPMQSIYFFRDADTELFTRVKEIGLEIPGTEPLALDSITLAANFRTAPLLVDRLNEIFARVFAVPDGSGVEFAPAEAAREAGGNGGPKFELHMNFEMQASCRRRLIPSGILETDVVQEAQAREIVELIDSHRQGMERASAAGEKYRIAVLARAKKSLAPIAEALHEAGIRFRAVELEKLAARSEILDALALGRALLNPHDRLAWLGVLRAPWCGLSLEDIHRLTSADDAELLARPIPELLDERLSLLTDEGRIAAERVLAALTAMPAVRASQPIASLGTWLQQAWLSLGGADCYDVTACANLDLLWKCLDSLAGGEQDLLGPALDAALGKLTALPDAETSSDCGVQLMTIHKSKGLEFEIVIVPDLQAKTMGTSRKMLSWMERGLQPEAGTDLEDDAITEFLVAPIQTKGADAGGARAWVEQAYKERESQEMRRILYVAATRAREELHLFARPAFKVEENGEFTLAESPTGLLATAWPGLEADIRARFESWKAIPLEDGDFTAPDSGIGGEQEVIESLAASGDGFLFALPSNPALSKPALLRRLPASYQPASATGSWGAGANSAKGTFRPYTRHEGGLAARALGTAVHALLEELARLRRKHDWQAARDGLQQFAPRVESQIRAAGFAETQAAEIGADAMRIARSAADDPIGQWILAPHAEAESEVQWTGVVSGSVTTVRVDRVFKAGAAPGSDGDSIWWIVDYKTAQAGAAHVSQLREMFAGQLEAYAQVLRNLHGPDLPIRCGLYYPRMLVLDWWEL